MSWRVVVISSRSKLDYKMDYLVVRTLEETKRVHLSEISVLMIESTAVSLTSYLMCELMKRKIDVIFCDEKRLPHSAVLPLYGSHDTSLKYRNQIKWSQDIKDFVWMEIVRAKINGQMSVLMSRKCDEYTLLESYTREILPRDISNREGHAAKVYFNAVFGMDFSRSQKNNTNAALNYGYGIFLSAFARECAANGYSTQIGIFHDNMFNNFNLASDLMEPFRVFVDMAVLEMDLDKFEHDEKMTLVKLLNDTVEIDGTNQYMLRAIKIYVKSVFDAMNDKDISVIKFPVYEL